MTSGDATETSPESAENTGGGGGSSVQLPENRFALELEFVQSLASPAYLHYLASMTNNDGQSLLLDPRFKSFLTYLQKTWTRPEYSRYVTYPHAFYFLDLLVGNDAFCRELAQVSFRNFCHQQQYFAWQNRFSTLYGGGGTKDHDDAAPSAGGQGNGANSNGAGTVTTPQAS